MRGSLLRDDRPARREAVVAGDPSGESGPRYFRIRDALNTSLGISPEDDQRYNYRGRYLVARPDYATFPELRDPETLEHFVRSVQGDGRGGGYFETPTVKKPVVRVGGARYCIGQSVSLCEIRQGRPVEIARLGTSGLMIDSGPSRHFYAQLNTIVLRSWMLDRRYTAADARRDAALGGISDQQRSGGRLSYYRPKEIDWVMPNFMQWLPVEGFGNDGTVKGLHELSRGETRVNNLGAPVSHGCLRLTRYGAVLARWWTPRGAKLFIHYTSAGYRQVP